jgi:hypothetical protein
MLCRRSYKPDFFRITHAWRVARLKRYGTNPEKPFYRILEVFVSMIAMRGASVSTQLVSGVGNTGESAIPSDLGRSSRSAEPLEVRD